MVYFLVEDEVTRSKTYRRLLVLDPEPLGEGSASPVLTTTEIVNVTRANFDPFPTHTKINKPQPIAKNLSQVITPANATFVPNLVLIYTFFL